jgi:hypothetical protein
MHGHACSFYLSNTSYLKMTIIQYITDGNESIHTSLTVALLTTRLARQAKRSVECDSSACTAAGVTAQMMAVLALPPSEGCRMRVSLESR